MAAPQVRVSWGNPNNSFEVFGVRRTLGIMNPFGALFAGSLFGGGGDNEGSINSGVFMQSKSVSSSPSTSTHTILDKEGKQEITANIKTATVDMVLLCGGSGSR